MAYGDIGAPVNTRKFVLTDITRPDMVHVAGDIYIIAYSDADGDGMVITIDITKDGVVGAAVISGLEFDTVDGWEPSIVHVSGEIFAIAYRGVDADGFVKTVNITAAGAITAVSGGSLEFQATACYGPDMIKVPGGTNVFAVVCRGDANQGIITTISITDAGAISFIASDETWANDVNNPQMVHVTGDIFAIAYRDNVYHGRVCTVDINAAGAIGTDVVASLEFDAGRGCDPTICHVTGEIFAIAYRGGDDDGFVVTVTISAAGAIALVGGAAGLLRFDTVYCTWPDIILLYRGICAIAYAGAFDDGYVATIQISAAGQITLLGSLEIDDNNGQQPSIIRVGGNQYAVAYIGNGLDGFVNTPTIETPVAPRGLTIMGIGS